MLLAVLLSLELLFPFETWLTLILDTVFHFLAVNILVLITQELVNTQIGPVFSADPLLFKLLFPFQTWPTLILDTFFHFLAVDAFALMTQELINA